MFRAAVSLSFLCCVMTPTCAPDYFWRKLVDEARFQVSAADRHISPAASQPVPPPVVKR